MLKSVKTFTIMTLVWLLLASLFVSTFAEAGGRGGHSTTFDANNFGGGWACFRSLASGTCGGATAHYSNATCDGSTNDASALTDWLTYASAQSGQVKLYIPPGSDCVINSKSFVFDTTHNSSVVVRNAIIWAYGASVDDVFIGGYGTYQNAVQTAGNCPVTVCQAAMQSATAGQSTVTLVTAGNASSFSVGDWVYIDAVSLQVFGYPPNWYIFESKLITAINGGVLTLNEPLKYSYLSTYPDLSTPPPSSIESLAGPATVHKLEPSWNVNLAIYGLRVRVGGGGSGENSGAGRTIALYDMAYGPTATGWAPTMVQSASIFYGQNGSPEFDKQIENLSLYGGSYGLLIVQSAALGNNVVINSISASTGMNGIFGNTTINNSSIPRLLLGPTGYGHGVALSVDGSYIPSAAVSIHRIQPEWVTYNNDGTFSLNGVDDSDVYSAVTPGQKYFFANTQCINNSIPHTDFTITGFTAGTPPKFSTNLPNTLPAPTCGGIACAYYCAYPAATITQKNAKAGSAELTQFAAPP